MPELVCASFLEAVLSFPEKIEANPCTVAGSIGSLLHLSSSIHEGVPGWPWAVCRQGPQYRAAHETLTLLPGAASAVLFEHAPAPVCLSLWIDLLWCPAQNPASSKRRGRWDTQGLTWLPTYAAAPFSTSATWQLLADGQAPAGAPFKRVADSVQPGAGPAERGEDAAVSR